MDAPLPPTLSTHPTATATSLACGMHVGMVAAVLVLSFPVAPPDMAPSFQVELVQWETPSPAAPVVAAAPAAAPQEASPPSPLPKPQPAPRRLAKPVPPVARPAPAATPLPSAVAADTTKRDETAGTTASETSESPPAEGAPRPQGKSGIPTDEVAYIPPSSSAAYLSNPKPAYPSLALKRGWEGVVVLLVRVDEQGNTTAVSVHRSSGHAILDRCAVEAVQRWRFTPARRAGQAVAAAVEVPIRFDLQDQATG